MKLWSYFENGGTRAIELAHRRWGKDEVALNIGAVAAHKRRGNYWHMLPEAAQARKAIWDAINPKSGMRRIDEAFPVELRETTINNEMKIVLKCGSIWQVIGSDNFNSLVGSPPMGVTFSEWALAEPRAWPYIRPILAENGGWALFITTVRGENHATKMYDAAKDDPEWFCETTTAHQSPVFSRETLERERIEYIREMGEDDGEALFRQEYLCDRFAPLVGAYYAKKLSDLEADGHMGDFPWEPGAPVYTASDIGRTDDCAVVFYQKHHLRIHIIDFECEPGKDVPWFAQLLQGRHYVYAGFAGGKPGHTLPWDAEPETFASPRSTVQQLHNLGIRTRIAPNLDVQDGIQAVRSLLPRIYFNTKNPKVRELVDALRNYQREWDDERKIFKKIALHNWASHPADALRYMALTYEEDNPSSTRAFDPGAVRPPTLEEVWTRQGTARESRL